MGHRFRAFTVVEYIIVVLALGILAIFVIPQFSRASQQSKQNNLKDVMQYLRTQVMVFKAQHQDIPPGYPNGNPMSWPDAGAFAAQMTQHSDISANVGGPGGAFPYGPYLTQVPPNPVNGLNTVKMIGNNDSIPAPDGTTGWIFKPQTQEVFANVKGKDDSGTPYSTY
jgi:type II secretory pathway pseudopilin PulG